MSKFNLVLFQRGERSFICQIKLYCTKNKMKGNITLLYQIQVSYISSKKARFFFQLKMSDTISNLKSTAFTRKIHKTKKVKYNFCVFCKNNGEDASYYLSHTLKDDNGRVICPILYRHSEPKLRISFQNYLWKPIMNSADYFTDLLPQRAIEKENKLLIDQNSVYSQFAS